MREADLSGAATGQRQGLLLWEGRTVCGTQSIHILKRGLVSGQVDSRQVASLPAPRFPSGNVEARTLLLHPGESELVPTLLRQWIVSDYQVCRL